MPWIRVEPPHLGPKIDACSTFFKSTAPTHYGHLTPGHLTSKINQKVKQSVQHLLELYLYNLGGDQPASFDFRIVVGFDLSIRRAYRKPPGPIQSWDWTIHVGIKEDPGLTEDEIYRAVKDKCRTFLGNPPSKSLWLIGDESSSGSDGLYTKFQNDLDIQKGPVLSVPVADSHYYRQPPAKGGLGVDGVLARQQIFSIV